MSKSRASSTFRVRPHTRLALGVAVISLVGSVLAGGPAIAAVAGFPQPKFDDDVPGASAAAVEDIPTPASSESVVIEGASLPEGGVFTIDLSPVDPPEEAKPEPVLPVEPEPTATASPIPTPTATSPAPSPSPEPTAPETSSPSPTAAPEEPSTETPEVPAPAPTVEQLEQDAPATPEAELEEPGRGWQALGDTGIEVAPIEAGASSNRDALGESSSSPDSVTITILSAKEREALGLTGLALKVQRADGQTGNAPVDIRVPGPLVENIYGADYAERVRWVVVSTGRAKAKGHSAEDITEQPGSVTSAREADTGSTVLSASVSASPMIIAAASSPVAANGTGSFTATDLKPSSSWDVSAQTGGFAWTYPMPAPPAAAGPMPSVALNYNSQSVDGETGSTNNQPSVVGDGWSLSGSGFIERSYVSCAKDDGAGGPITTSGDLCWKTNNATMSFAGHSGAIVRDTTTGIWKLEQDDGSRIERLVGTAQGCASNGTYNTECWRLTTTDGTQYYFGLNRLPGWSSGKAVTNSTWTVPVFGNDAGEPCNASSFAASSCLQGWRWNLDYVVDVHGNAEAFYYHAETNSYAAGGSSAVAYTRGGSLDRIEYGLKASTVYAANAATGKVTFGYSSYGRCADSVVANCTAQPLDGAATTPAVPAKYPDVPYDQNCSTSCSSMRSPSFWTVAQLNTVTTKVFTAGAYATVDVWTLGHSFPDPGDGTSAALWLTKVGHTGYAGSSSLSEPDTIFTGVTMQNRVWVIDGLAPLDKYRISSVRLQMGGVISVNYSGQDCTPAQAATILASAQSNTRRCYPQWWSPDVTPPQPAQLDLFHKYVVTSTVANPVTGGAGSDAVETYYDYSVGTPAWRYNDSPFTPDAYRTWSVYAGYDRVNIRVGSPSSPATQETTEYTFYRGMDGDRAAPSGGTKSVAVTGAAGVTDSKWLAGRTYRTKIRNGVGGTTASTTTIDPWTSGIKAANGYQTSRMVKDGTTTLSVPLAAGGTRTTTTQSTYDATYGYVLTTSEQREASATSKCTTTVYAPPNTTAWIIGLPQEVTSVGKQCSALSSASYPADSISGTRFAYDGLAVGGTPTKGDTTLVQGVDNFTGSTASTAHWVTLSTSQYDAMGRQTLNTDALGRTSSTVYTPSATAAAGSGPLASSVVTNTAPFSWVATTTVEPTRGNATSITDANGNTTTATYDPLGRTSNVWAIDRPQASFPSSPSTSYAYVLSTTGASSVSTTALAQANYVTAYSLYDGLGRPVQTQSVAAGGGAVVSDTEYDPAGRVTAANSAYWSASVSPSGSLFVPISVTQIPSRTETTFDGLSRPTASILMSVGSERFRTTYAYGGADRTDVTPPSGGTPTRSITNSLGQQTSLTQYLSSTIDPLATQVTTAYTYDVQGHMASMQDAANNTWSWTYDVLGRLKEADDPDSGTSSYTYDLVGNTLTSTNGRGQTIASTYDELNRKIGQYDTSPSGPLLASWTFDTLAKGQLASSSSYTGSVAGTPGLAYTTTITSIDAGYRPTARTTTIPTGAPVFGGTSYSEELSYYPDGSPNLLKVPAVGGLPAESIRSTYGGAGRLGGMRSATSIYLSGVAYTPIGQVAQYDRSSTTSSSTAYGYDQATGSLLHITETKLTGSTFTETADRTYERDNSGNIKSLVTTGGGTTETQCFTYDNLQNLTEAWTPSASACSTAPAGATLGGPAPYWTSYTVDAVTGNRTGTVNHVAPGTSSTTTSTYAYPAAGGSRPHAVSTVTKQVGSATPTVSNYSYDNSGNTTVRPGQTLLYNSLGKLTKTTVGTTIERNVYGADGELLLRTSASAGSTLYLGGTELKVSAGSSVISGTRTYSANGTPIAERTATDGVSGSTLKWLSPDIAGTALMATDASSGSIKRRYMDPFGNARGTATTWSSNHAFLNAPSSSTTKLSHLGAREYDPLLGRFITVDAVLVPTMPQQSNGYSYANNSPITFSDPSGNLMSPLGGCDGACSGGYRPGPSAQIPQSSAPPAAPGDGDNPKTSKKSVAPAPEIQWWNPTTWNGEIWQNVGAVAAGIAVGVAFTVAIVGAVGCTVVTFGVCGAVILGAAVVGGAAASVMTYNLSTGEKTDEGRLTAALSGGASGLVGGVGGAVASKVVSIIAAKVASASAEAATAATNTASLHLTYKPGWSPAQVAAADSKVASLNNQSLVVTSASRSGKSAADIWRAGGGTIPRGADIDHIVDLQLGGSNSLSNLAPLDASVNRSLGAQIAGQISSNNLAPGTIICSVTIGMRC